MSTAPSARTDQHTADRTDGAGRIRTPLLVAIPLAGLLLAAAGYLWWAEASYDGDSIGLGYVLAIIAAVPAGVALLLAVTALALRRRFAGAASGLAWCAAAAAAAPVAYLAMLVL